MLSPPAPCWFSWFGGSKPIVLAWPFGLTIIEDAFLVAVSRGQSLPQGDSPPSDDVPAWFLRTALQRARIRAGSPGTGGAGSVPDVPFHLGFASSLHDFLARHLYLGEPPEPPLPTDVASLEPLPEGNFVTVARCGAWKDVRIRHEFDARFGAGGWRTGYTWGPWMLDVRSGIQIYEDAYYQALVHTPELLQWLLQYQEVYDTSPSNIQSHCDYGIQEVEGAGQHWQDIAVRRVLRRRGLWFHGEKLLEIRGHTSEGYALNPGQLPFHRLDLFVQPRQYGWWRPDSIEDFSISNFAVQVPLSAALDTIRARGLDWETCEMMLLAQHPGLVVEMLRFGPNGPRTGLFFARTLSLLPEAARDELLRQADLSKRLREWWEILDAHLPQSAEIIDRLLSSEAESRAGGLDLVMQLEPRLRLFALDAACEDPARRLRHRAKVLRASV